MPGDTPAHDLGVLLGARRGTPAHVFWELLGALTLEELLNNTHIAVPQPQKSEDFGARKGHTSS